MFALYPAWHIGVPDTVDGECLRLLSARASTPLSTLRVRDLAFLDQQLGNVKLSVSDDHHHARFAIRVFERDGFGTKTNAVSRGGGTRPNSPCGYFLRMPDYRTEKRRLTG